MAAVLDKSRVTPRQLLFSVACFLQASSLLASFVMTLTGRESWISVVLGFVISLGLVCLYIGLVKRFPGMNLFSIHEAVYGTGLGKMISFLYVFFFLTMTSVNVNDVSRFTVDYIMPATPSVVIVLTLMFVCGWAARKGAAGICRMGFLFFILVTGITVANVLMLIKDMDLSNFLPAFQLPVTDYLKGAGAVATVPFGEILVFLMFVPNVDAAEGTGLRKPVFAGLAIGAATLLVVVCRNIGVLGNLVSVVSLPSYEAVRHIQIADVITRVDVLYALSMLFLQFFKISLYFYASALGIAQIFRLKNYTFLIPVIGALAAGYAFVVFGPSMENTYWGSHIVPVFAAAFEIALPMVTLLASLLPRAGRRHRAKEEVRE